MVSMDPKAAVMNYQFGERAKSELIVLSQLCIALPSFPEGGERAGGKKMLLLMMESVRNEIQYAATSTGHREFQNAASALSLAISLVESDKAEEAAGKIAQAISASTTPAQEAWQVLSEHGLL